MVAENLCNRDFPDSGRFQGNLSCEKPGKDRREFFSGSGSQSAGNRREFIDNKALPW
jgi:hypothetical protein